MKKINILGEEWTIEVRKREDDKTLDDNDGYTDTSVKLIVVEEMQQEKGSKISLAEYTKQVIRHEIVHAFLFESGLEACALYYGDAWSQNEEMVDWFAIQSPKILKAFKDAECI